MGGFVSHRGGLLRQVKGQKCARSIPPYPLEHLAHLAHRARHVPCLRQMAHLAQLGALGAISTSKPPSADSAAKPKSVTVHLWCGFLSGVR